MSSSNYDKKNILFWNELADIHIHKSDYNIKNYHPDNYSLRDIEIEKLGNIKGKRILHLQCHIGLDTFALEKLGASVIGVDYSQSAIDTANKIKDEFKLTSKFYCASVYELNNLNLGEFDIVFTSYGILVWLNDLDLWAENIYSSLKINGLFLIIDEHPVSRMFSNPNQDNTTFNNGYLHPYWGKDEPFKASYKCSYASNNQELKNQEQYIWSHSLSELINSLGKNNINIIDFIEYDKTFYKAFSNLTISNEGWWEFNSNKYSVPLMFSLLAIKKD